MNIFLVEDEPWALTELVQLFEKYQSEHTIYSFPNGDDALEMANEIRPDLVVTDITMPGMDGLELITQLNQLDATIKSIILSVHDEFQYAQQGLKLGVIDYILKPVKKATLYKTIDQAIEEIKNENMQRIDMGNWSVTQMLLSPSNKSEGTPEVINKGNYYIIHLFAGNWKAKKSWDESTDINDHELKALISNQVTAIDQVFCLTINSQQKLLLIPLLEQSKIDLIQFNLKFLYEKLKNQMIVHISHGRKNEQQNVNEVFTSLTNQTEKNMRFGLSSLLDPTIKNEEADLSEVWVKVRMIETFIMNGNIQKVTETATKIVLNLQNKKITQRQLSLFISNMYYALAYKCQLEKGTELNTQDIQENFEILKELTSFEQLSEWLSEMMINLSEQYSPSQLAPKNLIPRVIQWIHNHYQESLVFSQFADDHHVSLSYLSREFKNQTNYTFSEYVMRYRVEKAKEFFIEGVERTGDVCNLVGCEDPKHFSSIFKRIEGISPKDFKKQIGENMKD
jgi:YesN/AraC family two-component response regulator